MLFKFEEKNEIYKKAKIPEKKIEEGKKKI